MTLKEQDELIYKLFLEGKSCRSISQMLGKNNGYAFDRLKRMGIDTKRKCPYDLLSPSEIAEIRKRYKNGETAKRILVDYSDRIKSENTIVKIVRDAGIPIRQAKRHTNVNESYFDSIDTPEKAYVLGLLLSDGYVIQFKGERANRTPVWGIGLKEEDRYIIEFIRNEVEAKDKKICVNKKTKIASLTISSNQMVQSLKQYGVTPRKTYTVTFPETQVNPKYYCHIIRGYFDGNGSVTNGRCYFYGNETILTQIRDILMQYAKVSKRTVAYNKANHIWYFEFSSKKDIQNFVAYIYEASTIHMERKRKKFA